MYCRYYFWCNHGGGGGVFLENKKNTKADTFETYVQIPGERDGSIIIFLYFANYSDFHISAYLNGWALGENAPFSDMMTEGAWNGDDPIELEIDVDRIGASMQNRIYDVMTLHVFLNSKLFITPTQKEFYAEMCGVWEGMADGYGAVSTLDSTFNELLLKFSIDTSKVALAFDEQFKYGVLINFFHYFFDQGMPLLEVTRGLETSSVDIGIYTDGEESAIGGSVQVTYPASMGDMSESTTVTLEESTTLDVVKELGEGNPFIISVTPNEGYEVETLIGDNEVNIISIDDLKESYKIFFISTQAKWDGDGNKDSPYKISNKKQLKRLATVVNNGINFANVYFEQAADIDLSSEEWKPIGQKNNDNTYAFLGHYDGKRFKIQNLTINNLSEASSGGLFGVIEGAEIKNIVIDGGEINVSNVSSDAGGIVGRANSSTISDCKSNVNVHSGKTAGGIVGLGSGLNIYNCAYSGDVVCSGGDAVGGIVGDLAGNSEMVLCVFNGTATADNGTKYCGGLYGCVKSGNAKSLKCTAKGTISGDNTIGGLAGLVGSEDILQNCSFYGKIVYSGNDLSKAGTLGGVVSDNVNNIFTACSFYGTSNVALNLLGDKNYATTLNTCWAKCNDQIQVSSSVLANREDWEKYWGIAADMIDGLPLQKEFYWLTKVEDSTAEQIDEVLANANVFLAN